MKKGDKVLVLINGKEVKATFVKYHITNKCLFICEIKGELYSIDIWDWIVK